MTCQQCAAELPDSATFCYQCGTPIRAVAFSYLPAGAPPWPATVPPLPRQQTNEAAQRLEMESSAAKTADRARRSPGGILLIIALLILAPILGIGITLGALFANGQFPPRTPPKPVTIAPTAQPTAAATGTPNPSASSTPSTQGQLPTPTSFQDIDATSSTKLGLAIKYPGDWVKDTLQSSSTSQFLSMHPTQQLGIDLSVEHFSASGSANFSSANAVNQNNLQGFSQAQGVSNFQVVTSTPQQVTVGGVQWDKMDATFANQNGLQFHLTTIAVQHNHTYFDIQFYSPDVVYNEAMQKYFQPMLDSFRFLS